MHELTKIATCNYCGNRAILQLAGQVQHELACGSCGARLHTLKQMPAAGKTGPATGFRPIRQPAPGPARPATQDRLRTPPPKPRKSKRKRGKKIWSMLEDAFDEITDIFD